MICCNNVLPINVFGNCQYNYLNITCSNNKMSLWSMISSVICLSIHHPLFIAIHYELMLNLSESGLGEVGWGVKKIVGNFWPFCEHFWMNNCLMGLSCHLLMKWDANWDWWVLCWHQVPLDTILDWNFLVSVFAVDISVIQNMMSSLKKWWVKKLGGNYFWGG